MTRQKTVDYEIGSGNVFADLELDDADELLIHAPVNFASFLFRGLWIKDKIL